MIINESYNKVLANKIKIGDHISTGSVPIYDYDNLDSHKNDAYLEVVRIEDPYLFVKIDPKIAKWYKGSSDKIDKVHKSNATLVVSKNGTISLLK